ncbi:MAG TPA: glycosyltransferase family 39 protein [Candidatus Paceibacterota bacterium]|jgi:4-amino-4-deoxy-L-arabinose transferase and related glycosyltransferases of PMT family
MERFRRNSQTIAATALILLGAFFATFRLTESPAFWYDEGWYMEAAANLATVGIDGLQIAPGHIEHLAVTTVGYPLIYPLALWMKIFGTSVFAARFLMALFIIGFLVSAYVLARRLFGNHVALCALALLMTFPPLYGNGKSILGEVPGMLFLVLSLFSWSRAKISPNRYPWLVLSGLCAGLCASTKPVYLVFLAALVAGAVIECRRKTFMWREITIGVVATIVPLMIWLFVQFGAGDSASGIIGYYANPYHEHIVAVVVKNFIGLFKSVSGLFTLAIGGLWLSRIMVAWKRADKLAAEEIMSLVFAILVFLAFLRTAGWYRYLFPMQALTLLFLPEVVRSLSELFVEKIVALRKLAIVLSIVLSVLGLYQLCFSSWVADGYASHRTAELSSVMSRLPASQSVLFYNAPEAVPFLSHRNYYQYILPAAGIIGVENMALAQSGAVDIIILETEAYRASDPVFKSYRPQETIDKFTLLTAIMAR